VSTEILLNCKTGWNGRRDRTRGEATTRQIDQNRHENRWKRLSVVRSRRHRKEASSVRLCVRSTNERKTKTLPRSLAPHAREVASGWFLVLASFAHCKTLAARSWAGILTLNPPLSRSTMDAFLRGLFGLNHQHHQQHGEAQGHSRGGKGGVVVVAAGSAAAGTAVAAAAAAAAQQPAARVIPPAAAASVAVAVANDAAGVEEASSWMMLDDENVRKRSRASSSENERRSRSRSRSGGGVIRASASRARSGGARTPGLVLSPRSGAGGDLGDLESEEDDQQRPVKRFRGERGVIPVSPLAHSRGSKKEKAAASPLKLLPDDMLAHCLSFLGGVEDRFSIQATSKQFRKLSNSDAMRRNIQVGGDRQTGLHGIIREHDTPESASKNLDPYVQAGNLEAIYMYVSCGRPIVWLQSVRRHSSGGYVAHCLLFHKKILGSVSSRATATRTWRPGSAC
jgi:hypothetical protein